VNEFPNVLIDLHRVELAQPRELYALNLSFPEIISARSDDAAPTERA
jgi:hypothetical protein